MGKPIVYCSICGTGLREGGSARERIHRSEGRIFCRDCRPPGAEPDRDPPSGTSRKIATARIPRVGETPRAFRAASRPRRPAGLFLGLGAAALVALLALGLSGGRPPAPPPDVVERRPAPPPPLPPSFAAELAKLDQELRGPLDREDFRQALAALEGARARRAAPEWTTPIDERIRDVNARAMALFSALKTEAVAAAKDGNRAALDALRARVDRWGRPDFATELDRAGEAAARAAVEARPWQALFDGATTGFIRDSSAASWTVRDGAVVRVRDNAAQSKLEIADGELRLRFSIERPENVFFNVRQGDGWFRADWMHLKERIQLGRVHELHFSCRGPEVTASLDGRPLPLLSHGAPVSGCLQFNGGETFRLLSVEFRPAP